MQAKYEDERLALPAQYTPGKVGIVTVLFNSALVLEDFFASVEHQTYSNYTLYCVDNASKDDSIARCRRPNTVVIECGANLGVAAGNNRGTRAAVADGCDFILYLNNDVIFGPSMIADLVEALANNACSMTTPLIFYHDRPAVIWAAGGYFQPWLGYRCQHHRQGELGSASSKAIQVAYTPTCCVLVRRELFAEIGLMDERYFVYYDDTDFMLRAFKHGKRLFLVPYATLWHKVSSLTGKDSDFTMRYLTRNQALYHHKNVTPLGAWLMSALYCSYFIAMWLRGRMTRAETQARLRYWVEGIRFAHGVEVPGQ